MIIWRILDIENLKSEPFELLTTLTEKYNLVFSTVANKWSKAKKEHPQNNELEIFIIVDKYKITKEKVN